MKPTSETLILSLTLAVVLGGAVASGAEQVGRSPWGPDDEIGRLNLMTPRSRAEILRRVSGGKEYDLSVEYFIGMPSWQAAGDPHFRLWMTHTPGGTVNDDPLNLGTEMNEHVSYTGAAISLYTHMGTHIDALNHFGLDGKIWNGFRAHEHLGDRGWNVAGAENIPPIIARGVLIDVAAAKGVDMLENGYRVTRQDLVEALEKQKVSLLAGDVVLIRTGRMKLYEDAASFMADPPGMGMSAARFLVEEKEAMIVGADNLSFEAFPSEVEGNYVPVHTYLLAEQGTPILELVYLEELSRDAVYEFAFIGGSLKLRGADAAPIRPIAIPVTKNLLTSSERAKTAVNPEHLPDTTQYGYSQAVVVSPRPATIYVVIGPTRMMAYAYLNPALVGLITWVLGEGAVGWAAVPGIALTLAAMISLQRHTSAADADIPWPLHVQPKGAA